MSTMDANGGGSVVFWKPGASWYQRTRPAEKIRRQTRWRGMSEDGDSWGLREPSESGMNTALRSTDGGQELTKPREGRTRSGHRLLGGEVLSPRHWGEMKPPKVARHWTSGFLGCHVVLLEGIVPTGRQHLG